MLDSSFGINGKIISNFGGPPSAVISALIQSDDKIVITLKDNYGSSSLRLVRLFPNGAVDSSFGENGVAVVGFRATNYLAFFPPSQTSIQKDDKIIIAGSTVGSTIGAVRFKSDPVTVSLLRNIAVTEGNSGTTPARFKLVLNRPADNDVKVNYTTVDSTAVKGSDYVATSGTALIRAGKISKNIFVNVIGDNVKEKNEKFRFVISNPVNAQLGQNNTAICTIKNDDAVFAVSTANSMKTDLKTAVIKAYPNPVKDVLRIDGLDASKKTSISVIDMNGNTLVNIISGSSATMNVQKLAAGVYEVKIENGEEIRTIKFVKQ